MRNPDARVLGADGQPIGYALIIANAVRSSRAHGLHGYRAGRTVRKTGISHAVTRGFQGAMSNRLGHVRRDEHTSRRFFRDDFIRRQVTALDVVVHPSSVIVERVRRIQRRRRSACARQHRVRLPVGVRLGRRRGGGGGVHLRGVKVVVPVPPVRHSTDRDFGPQVRLPAYQSIDDVKHDDGLQRDVQKRQSPIYDLHELGRLVAHLARQRGGERDPPHDSLTANAK